MYRTRRSYLKHVRRKHDHNPSPDVAALVGKGKDLNPEKPLPHRNGIVITSLDGKTGKTIRRWTPSMTEPMADRVESWRHHIKDRPEWFSTKILDTHRKVLMFFSDFTDNAIYFFQEIDGDINRYSFTMRKSTAMVLKFNVDKIPWKEANNG